MQSVKTVSKINLRSQPTNQCSAAQHLSYYTWHISVALNYHVVIRCWQKYVAGSSSAATTDAWDCPPAPATVVPSSASSSELAAVAPLPLVPVLSGPLAVVDRPGVACHPRLLHGGHLTQHASHKEETRGIM